MQSTNMALTKVKRTYLNELPETALRDPGSDLSSSGTSEMNRWLGLPSILARKL